MFVVNFDFSDLIFPLKIIAINIPVIITETLAYPLQRLQTLLVSQPKYITNSQFKQAQLIIRNMIAVQGFPKLLHGMRYTVDYMGTQMTTKFLLFDFLMQKTTKSNDPNIKWKIYLYCFMANALGTITSQIAFNYQTIASSLPIDKSNRPQNVKILLQNYTRTNKFPINGLKYTLPVSILNTAIQLLILHQTASIFARRPDVSYIITDLVSAFLIFTATSFPLHYAFQRQVEICKKMKQRSIPYTRGLLGSLLRYNIKGMALFGIYLTYFEMKSKSQIADMLQKKQTSFDKPYQYRK